MNHLTQIWDLASKKTTYTYDRKNRLTSIRHHNGTQQHRDYNAAGQLTELQALDINGHIIVSYQFSYDAAGNIVQEAVTPDITQLTDSLPLLDYGFANRLGSVDGQAAEFDGDGNMVKAPNGETLRFDTRNRLVEYGGIEYVFNAENQRVGMRTAEGLTQYVVNPVPALSQTLVKTEPDGSQTYYVYGLGLVSEHGPQGYRTYHYDLRGSTVALSDEQGVVIERFVYSPFGGLVSGDISATPFLYNGRDGVITDANGLYHMRARFYSPELRRFVNQDVLLGFVAEGQTLNRYAYVTGNPVSFIDPFGLRGLPTAPSVRPAPIRPGVIPNPNTYTNDNIPTLRPYLWDIIAGKPPTNPYEDDLFFDMPSKIFPDGVRKTFQGIPFECVPYDRDRCRDLLRQMYERVYGVREKAMHGTQGLLPRYLMQLYDPNQLYQSDIKSYNRHNEQFIADRENLRTLIRKAQKLGCYIPEVYYYFANLNPPSKPGQLP